MDTVAVTRYWELHAGLAGWLPVRLVPERTRGGVVQVAWCCMQGGAQQLLEAVARSEDEGRACFVQSSTVRASGVASATDVIAMGYIVVDLDGTRIEEALGRLHDIGLPSMVVRSGGVNAQGERKRHVYFKVERADAHEVGRLTHLRALLAAKVGGDSSFKRNTQLIRVAGSTHYKQGAVPVEIESESATCYSLVEINASIEALVPLAGIDVARARTRMQYPMQFDDMFMNLKEVRANGESRMTRFDYMTRIIGYYVAGIPGHYSYERALHLVHVHNTEYLKPPWPDSQVVREFNRIYRLHNRKRGRDAADRA